MMREWQKTLWLRQRLPIDENNITAYKDAVSYRINYQPASGYLAIQEYGEKVSKIWTAYVDIRRYKGIFHEGDIVYLDGDEPKYGTEEYENGSDATALVTSVLEQNKLIRLEFTRIKYAD
jgi:hypothetical protein